MEKQSHNLNFHYCVSMRYVNTLNLSMHKNPFDKSTGSVLLKVDPNNGILVPQFLTQDELQFLSEWVLPAPKPNPKIEINSSHIIEYHSSAVIQFPAHQTSISCSHPQVQAWNNRGILSSHKCTDCPYIVPLQPHQSNNSQDGEYSQNKDYDQHFIVVPPTQSVHNPFFHSFNLPMKCKVGQHPN